MDKLTFYDANCRIGTPMNGGLESAPTWEALVAEMDRIGVARAVVAHVNAATAGTILCNSQLNAFLQDHTQPRLTGCWSILPDCLNEKIPAGKAFFQAMKSNRIGMVEICPASHRWVPHRFAVGRQFDALAERKVVIKVSLAEIGSWTDFYELVAHFPKNRFLIADTGVWGCDRYIRPLFETTDNVFMDSSEYWVAEGLAALVRQYGARQILFGSGYPRRNHGNQMLNIARAQISSVDRRLIAGGNLQRMLKEVQL